MKKILIIIVLTSIGIISCDCNPGPNEHTTEGLFGDTDCACDAGFQEDQWKEGCVAQTFPHIFSVSAGTTTITINLANTATAFDSAKITLRKDGFTGPVISYTSITGIPSSTATMNLAASLGAGTYYLIFQEGAFSDSFGVSEAAFFTFTK